MNFAWFAGYIDGDGSISILRGKNQLRARVLVRSSQEWILDYIKSEMGYGYRYRGIWEVSNPHQVKDLLEKIIPYLMLKNKQAVVVLEFAESRIINKYKLYTKREFELKDLVQSLNIRSPTYSK